MTAWERLSQEIENYNRDENYNSLLDFSMQERRFIIEFAESLAKERAVEFYLEALSEEEQRDESVIELVKSKYNTFLAEKRKEGAEKSFCECGSQKDIDCKYCTSCNKFHSV